MEKIYKRLTFFKTRLYVLCNLVFFVVLFSECSYQSQDEIKLLKDKDRWVGIFIPSDLLKGVDKNNPSNDINVRVSGNQENMLGEFSSDNEGVVFKPIVGLTSGTTYEVLYKGI
jgi:hypothetical protein